MGDVIVEDVLFPDLDGLLVQDVELLGGEVRVVARACATGAGCPVCGALSLRVHSGYERHLTDTAVGGRRVVLRLRVRRFRCATLRCPRTIFVEQVDGLTFRYGRRSTRLHANLQAIALMLAGRAGARLAEALDTSVSRSTLLRLIRALPDPQISTPRVLGVDDFALRKVIWSRPKGVLHVEHERVRCPDLLGGGGYLPPSSTQILRRSHACSAGRVTDGTAGFVDGGR